MNKYMELYSWDVEQAFQMLDCLVGKNFLRSFKLWLFWILLQNCRYIVDLSVQQQFHNSDYGKKVERKYKHAVELDVDQGDEKNSQNKGPELMYILDDNTLI